MFPLVGDQTGALAIVGECIFEEDRKKSHNCKAVLSYNDLNHSDLIFIFSTSSISIPSFNSFNFSAKSLPSIKSIGVAPSLVASFFSAAVGFPLRLFKFKTFPCPERPRLVSDQRVQSAAINSPNNASAFQNYPPHHDKISLMNNNILQHICITPLLPDCNVYTPASDQIPQVFLIQYLMVPFSRTGIPDRIY